MINCEEVLEINSSDEENNGTIIIDDDNQDKIYSNDKTKDQVSTPSKNITITLEDGPDKNKLNSTKIVIEIDDVQSSQKQPSLNICQATKSIMDGMQADVFTLEFLHFIELCLKLERSDGMIRIIQRNLIPNYKAADRTYVESNIFRKFLEEVISKIEMDPQRKFFCMKEVCEMLKSSPCKAQSRKRVSLITLDKKVSEQTKNMYNNEMLKRRKVHDVIDLDKIADIIDLEVPDSDDLILVTDEKENRNNNLIKNSVLIPQTTDSNVNRLGIIEDEVHKKQDQIKKLEDHLKYLKSKLKMFEELEVVRDDSCSPYLICDGLKAEIVDNYKTLCELTGEQFVRKPKLIKLSAPEGHHPGPAARLERWLNSRAAAASDAAADGHLAFPDFIDVVKCVTEANAEDGLGWVRHQILYQARALFTQCGKALQRRRQRREWRDLICKVEPLGEDPADSDPALEARLMENHLLAMRKEDELFQHFASLVQNSNTRTNKKKSTVIYEPEAAVHPKPYASSNTMIEIEISGEMAYSDVLQENLTSGLRSEEPEDVKPLVIPRPIDPETEIVCSDSEDYSSTDEEVSDFELDTVLKTKRPEDLNQVNIESNMLQEASPNDAENVNSDINKTDLMPINKTASTEIKQKESTQTNSKETDNKDRYIENYEGLRDNADSDILGEEDSDRKADENVETVEVKSEPALNNPTNQRMSAEDTVKILLAFDKSILESGGACVTSTVFDIEEPIVFIEISSSESESDQDDS